MELAAPAMATEVAGWGAVKVLVRAAAARDEAEEAVKVRAAGEADESSWVGPAAGWRAGAVAATMAVGVEASVVAMADVAVEVGAVANPAEVAVGGPAVAVEVAGRNTGRLGTGEARGQAYSSPPPHHSQHSLSAHTSICCTTACKGQQAFSWGRMEGTAWVIAVETARAVAGVGGSAE